MSTGLFPIRQERGGSRPLSHSAIAAREADIDARVADCLADGMTFGAISRALDIGPGRINASFRRICMRLGDQAR